VPTAARMVLTLIAPVSLCCLFEVGVASTSVPVAGAQVVATSASACVKTTTTPIEVPGDPNITIADTCQTSHDGIPGGGPLPPAYFARATKQGDLLVAAVLCGVLQAGMSVPKLTAAPGWDKAKKRTGGIQGGLEAAIYYQADNPGGISSVPLGHVPAGSDDVSCTTFTWEITGAGDSSSLDAAGSASVVGGGSISVDTSTATQNGHDLVLVAETDGSEYPPNEYSVSHDFDLVSVWANGQTYQPGTFSALVTAQTGVQKTKVSQTSAQWWDSTAVIAALTI
jgi:hypothetical protein